MYLDFPMFYMLWFTYYYALCIRNCVEQFLTVITSKAHNNSEKCVIVIILWQENMEVGELRSTPKTVYFQGLIQQVFWCPVYSAWLDFPTEFPQGGLSRMLPSEVKSTIPLLGHFVLPFPALTLGDESKQSPTDLHHFLSIHDLQLL